MLRWSISEVGPPLLFDPLGCIRSLGIHREANGPIPPVYSTNSIFESGDKPHPAAAMLAAPWNTDDVAAGMAAHLVRNKLMSTGTRAEEAAVRHLLETRPELGHGWYAFLAGGLLSASADLRTLVGEVFASGLPSPGGERIGEYVGQIAAAGGSGLARAGEALASAASISRYAAVAADEAFRGALPHVTPEHRHCGEWLEAFEVAFDCAGRRALAPDHVRALERLHGGNTRAATAAARLLGEPR